MRACGAGAEGSCGRARAADEEARLCKEEVLKVVAGLQAEELGGGASGVPRGAQGAADVSPVPRACDEGACTVCSSHSRGDRARCAPRSFCCT